MKLSMFAGHLPFLLSVSLMLACVIGYKARRKSDERRSPVQGRLRAHLPGEQLWERILDHNAELLMSILIMWMSFPLMFSAWAGLHVQWQDIRFGGTEAFYCVLAVAWFAYGLHRYIRFHRLRKQASDGQLAEQVTGVQLNRLVADGCRVLHDVPAEGFNLDHVVVAPHGVYVVETKSVRKPRGVDASEACRVAYDGSRLQFPDFSTAKPIEQAARQARWLHELLRVALGQPVPVIPVVALPGWYVEREPAARASAVLVISPMGRGAEFMARGAERIDARQRELVVQALALRYPRIEQ